MLIFFFTCLKAHTTCFFFTAQNNQSCSLPLSLGGGQPKIDYNAQRTAEVVPGLSRQVEAAGHGRDTNLASLVCALKCRR